MIPKLDFANSGIFVTHFDTIGIDFPPFMCQNINYNIICGSVKVSTGVANLSKRAVVGHHYKSSNFSKLNDNNLQLRAA